MSRKTISLVLMIGGFGLMVLSLVADLIRIGSYWGFNWAQITGTAIGFVILVCGLVLWFVKGKTKK